MTRWPRPFVCSLLLAALVLLGSGAALAQDWGRRSSASDEIITFGIVALVVGAFISITMLFAQVKLFSINSSLKGILKELRPGTEQRNDISSIDSSLKEILKELRKRDGVQPKE
jgi:hypothetical protein